MPKRKKANRYRFRGNLSRLEERIAGVKAKLADPKDPDAKGWLTRWLKSAELSCLANFGQSSCLK